MCRDAKIAIIVLSFAILNEYVLQKKTHKIKMKLRSWCRLKNFYNNIIDNFKFSKIFLPCSSTLLTRQIFKTYVNDIGENNLNVMLKRNERHRSQPTLTL